MADTYKNYLNSRIIVIGAGIAGLNAAVQLKKNGFTNVCLLEARERVGGRVHTINYGSSYIEMGAQWIHGQIGNLVYEIAKANDLVDDSAPNYMEAMEKSPDNTVYCNDDHIILETMEYLGSLVDLIDEIDCDDNKKKHELLSFAEYIKTNSHNFLNSDSSQIQDLKHAVLHWFFNIQCELAGCENLNLVSTKLLPGYKECDGNHTVELKQGYFSIVKILLDQIPNDWIIFNKVVNHIKWNTHDAQVTLKCEDNSSFFADRVIITLPLGYLKKHGNNLFDPPLPLQKLKAIDSTGFGAINKLYLEFDIPFWNTGDIFKVLWTSQLENDFKRNTNLNPWCKDINRFAYVLNQPNLLCGWVSGTGAYVTETLTDQEIIDHCHWLLTKLLTINDVSKPCKLLRSKWYSDQFSCGTYSFLSLRNEEENCGPADLAAPIMHPLQCGLHPALLFAGEATNTCFYSTVHGAAESGIREANRITAHYQYHELLKSMKIVPKRVKILIIGAGAAGLTCAHRCWNLGMKDILILEALDRIGGRICTIDFGESILEIGAQWIHGEKNVLHDYCKESDLLESNERSFEGKGLFCMSNGKTIPQNVVKETFEFIEVMKIDLAESDDVFKALDETFENYFQNYLINYNDKPETKQYIEGIFDWFKRFEIVDNGCDSLKDLCISTYMAWKDCPGIYHTDLKAGFCSYIKSLVDNIPQDCILKSKPVKCLNWQKNIFRTTDSELEHQLVSEFPVFVQCENDEWFVAENVVVTPSVGFLKANVDSFFKPPLPSLQKEVLSDISFGTANKIFLVFEKAFWKKDDLGFQLIWMDDSFKQKYSNPKDNWVFGITGFDRVRNQQNILIAWIGGIQAKKMENIEKTVIGETCAEILRQFLNDPEIPTPVKIIRSTWNNNPYIKGSYSSRPIEFFTSQRDIKQFQEPVYSDVTLFNGSIVKCPSILFAGEACDAEYFSSVHGAMQSGIAAADKIFAFNKSLSSC